VIDEEDDEEEEEDEELIEVEDREEDNNEDEEEDSDPNGAGEQYIDVNDKEFIPKRSLPKTARKSIEISMSSKLSKAAKKGFN
jgi:hypothetical protein